MAACSSAPSTDTAKTAPTSEDCDDTPRKEDLLVSSSALTSALPSLIPLLNPNYMAGAVPCPQDFALGGWVPVRSWLSHGRRKNPTALHISTPWWAAIFSIYLSLQVNLSTCAARIAPCQPMLAIHLSSRPATLYPAQRMADGVFTLITDW